MKPKKWNTRRLALYGAFAGLAYAVFNNAANWGCPARLVHYRRALRRCGGGGSIGSGCVWTPQFVHPLIQTDPLPRTGVH